MIMSDVPIAARAGKPQHQNQRRDDHEAAADTEQSIQRPHHQPDSPTFIQQVRGNSVAQTFIRSMLSRQSRWRAMTVLTSSNSRPNSTSNISCRIM